MNPAHQVEIEVSWKRSSVLTSFFLAATVNGALGCLLALVGGVTPEWVVTDGDVSAGVLIVCKEAICKVFAPQGYIAASKVFVVVAFFCAVAAVVGNVIYYFKFLRKNIVNRSLPRIGAVFYFIAAGLDAASVIIFAVEGRAEAAVALNSSVSLGYSFTLTIVASVFFALSGCLTLFHFAGLPSKNENFVLNL